MITFLLRVAALLAFALGFVLAVGWFGDKHPVDATACLAAGLGLWVASTLDAPGPRP